MSNKVNLISVLLMLLVGLIWEAIGQAEFGSDKQFRTAPPEAVRLGEGRYRIGRLEVDMEKSEVIIRGWVNMSAGLIEYLACSAGGKLHESILVLDTKPIHLQVALILLGLEAEEDSGFQNGPGIPKGDPVEIWIQWSEDGRTRRVRAEQMVFDNRSEKPMPETHWVFTGSVVYQGRFIAEIERSLIATYHDPAAIINNPLPEGADDTIYYVNSELVPKRGTSVILTIKAIGKRRSDLDSLTEEYIPSGGGQSGKAEILFQEGFDEGTLDVSRWHVTKDGDLKRFAADLQETESEEAKDYRLRLMANTLGTSDPVKYMGIRSTEKIDLSGVREISFDLDWSDQQNGCYLTAGIYICPVESQNPKKERDWLGFEWVGVPPGKNIRTNVCASVDGLQKELYADWGPTDEKGKPQGWQVNPGNHRIRLLLGGEALRVWVDSKHLCHVVYPLNFSDGHLYLQMSSGTNYPDREVYFDNITITTVGTE